MNFFNAHILTQNEKNPLVSSMLVEGEWVKEVEADLSDGIDLDGRVIIPGFNDAHVHVWKIGQLASFIIDLRGVKSISAIQDAVRKKAATLPAGQWIVGRGFNEQILAEGRMPVKEDLDTVTQQHPVYLIRTCAHIATINSLALSMCGLGKDTKAPQGGLIGRNKDGSMTGIFYETALGLITKHLPAPSKSDYKEMIRKGAELLLSVGVTSATDPAVDPLLLEAYLEMSEEELPIRMNLMPILLPDGETQPYPIPHKFQSDRMKVDTVKFFADGGLSGQTAALKGTYRNSTDKGILRLDRHTFLSLAQEAQRRGFRIGTHAIGDEAIELVLDVYKELYREFGNTRNRIEHFGLPTSNQIESMAEGRFVAVPQPVFLYELGENFRQSLSDDYINRCYPVRSLLDANIPVAFSTDAPVVKSINPFVCLRAAVDRMTSKGNLIASEEGIDLEDAILLYTLGSAYAEGTDHLKGSLEPGKLADFLILDVNPFELENKDLDSVKIEEVYVGGKRILSTTN